MFGRSLLQQFTVGVFGGRGLTQPDGGRRKTSRLRSTARGSWWHDRHRSPARRWPSGPASRRAPPCGCRRSAGTVPRRRGWSSRPVCRRRRCPDRSDCRSQHDRGEHQTVAAPTTAPASAVSGRTGLASRRRSGSWRRTGLRSYHARVGVEYDVGVLEAEPPLGQRKPRLVGGFLGAEQDSVPVQARGAASSVSARSSATADGVQHTLGQARRGVRRRCPPSAPRPAGPPTAPRKPRVVGQAADDPVGPARFALLALEDRHRRLPEFAAAPAARSAGR